MDIRNNGGGRVGLSTLLSKYISKIPFRVADTVAAKTSSLGKYAKYITGHFFNNIEMAFAKKGGDKNFHFRRFEKHFFKPKKNSYDGKVYVLIAGNTFSASTLFCNAVKAQSHVTLVGEESGGGAYGNSGIMIPTIVLPNTHIRVRLPLYKLVQVNHGQIKGSGVLPDVLVPPNYDAFKNGYDKKMQVTKQLIFAKP